MSNANRLTELRQCINQVFTQAEPQAISGLIATLGDYDSQAIGAYSQALIEAVRAKHKQPGIFEAFLHEYSLNSDEGIVLMSIAEALLRIPDRDTQNLFLRDKLADADWHAHWLHSDSLPVNLASGSLWIGGKMEALIRQRVFDGLLSRLGEALIRAAIKQAMQQMAKHFVIAEDITAAVEQAGRNPAYRYSFDMLGEAALTEDDAERYFAAYRHAIVTLAESANADLFANPGISIKLSALYPRYEPLQYRYAVPAISNKLLVLAKLALAANISVTVDAEEAERLDMSLDIFTAVSSDPALTGWPGFGLAVQAYQKRAEAVIEWLAALAESQLRTIPIRLVKGAYWDSEIKRAQENGWDDYPVYTRKAATDLSYLACARLILSRPQAFYPQFATHNAHSVAAICEFGKDHPGFEFQRLHGMGSALYDELLNQRPTHCRVYAPVGGYRELLPYLVRRLLENGANTSFINQIEDPQISTAMLSVDPLIQFNQVESKPLAVPDDLFGAQRRNSQGLNLSNPEVLQQLQQDLAAMSDHAWQAAPLIAGQQIRSEPHPVYSPHDRHSLVGEVVFSSQSDIEQALQQATSAFNDWRLCPVGTRAGYLRNAADLFEQQRLELAALCIREGGRTVRDALAEVREAVDLCRYYAACAVEQFAQPQRLPGPTGEDNQLFQIGRGVFVCISPWNFPIAIFIGQIAAALVAGNTVIAKPALQTSLTGMACVRLLREAGIPENVLQFLPGDGAEIGRHLLSDGRIAGVAFTGSGATARLINRQLADRHGAIAALIAETGGQNVMIADSSAHQEQLVADALQSAFNSAGQRCSALRVLFLPTDIADSVITRLIGAMRLLRVGSPLDIASDVGPIIDQRALNALNKHIETLKREAKLLYQLPLPADLADGCFFPPTLAEIPALSFLDHEVFGPILHIVRYQANELAKVVEAINSSGYGLTLGIHSRISATMRYIRQHARVGNIYINRNMIGAVVGVQPFGGMGLSGTGPKAGGPNYLQRFANEQTLSTNLTAIGGNPWLLRK
ncbi:MULTISPECIES: bifunctional proline dehydrogenase/L-glutamate gamma-semialdehyde dehydrogenase PutA [Methylomonas]|uniref:Bifunctional protein PutA n=2 Tax=Methylomonas TaxID=416 RepID=A0A126T7I8_9GAMM|nr:MULTISPECIES: bifunctional proline dehydrogenase/L-glutamate gamma-semialdehyde dehydrogenase PutA [Methylomonas]AMK78047.1 integrase [Methylomonas denitrificans]OAI07655.1 bifunctional proline dehydrogenase/L-glutamate gamma-semialdehyde dehydrogenase [Methylomonas methanica]TCV85582.1 L-proline dehydrogenase /delta-1-pyrroline-5-carboxylate dehydrogenase [Methylomonas methanica]